MSGTSSSLCVSLRRMGLGPLRRAGAGRTDGARVNHEHPRPPGESATGLGTFTSFRSAMLDQIADPDNAARPYTMALLTAPIDAIRDVDPDRRSDGLPCRRAIPGTDRQRHTGAIGSARRSGASCARSMDRGDANAARTVLLDPVNPFASGAGVQRRRLRELCSVQLRGVSARPDILTFHQERIAERGVPREDLKTARSCSAARPVGWTATRFRAPVPWGWST